MPPGYMVVNGAWEEFEPSLVVGGAWEDVQEGHIVVNGAWEQWYSRGASYFVEGTTVYRVVFSGTNMPTLTPITNALPPIPYPNSLYRFGVTVGGVGYIGYSGVANAIGRVGLMQVSFSGDTGTYSAVSTTLPIIGNFEARAGFTRNDMPYIVRRDGRIYSLGIADPLTATLIAQGSPNDDPLLSVGGAFSLGDRHFVVSDDDGTNVRIQEIIFGASDARLVTRFNMDVSPYGIIEATVDGVDAAYLWGIDGRSPIDARAWRVTLSGDTFTLTQFDPGADHDFRAGVTV